MKVHDGVDRDALQNEIEAIEEVQADRAADQTVLEAKAASRASAHSKLAALGLSDDEIKALVG
jgi:hypothetical protein